MLTHTIGFSVQAGAAVVFAGPPTKIHAGNVCAFGAITGNYGQDYVFMKEPTPRLSSLYSNDNGEDPDEESIDEDSGTRSLIAPAPEDEMAPFPEDSYSNLIGSFGCDPRARDGTESVDSPSLFYLLKEKLTLPLIADPKLSKHDNAVRYTLIDSEIGGQTFYPGIYYASSLTMAANTQVTLKGNGKFQFISGDTMVTSANTNILLEENLEATIVGAEGYGKPAGTPTSHQIEWTVTVAATLGALSEVKGSILAGAAITLGAEAKISGVILAMAGVTLGAECDINGDKVNSPSH
jgi:hypothetical protein